MNKNKIYLALAVLAVGGMVGQWMFYETQAEAQLNTYTIPYTSLEEARQIMILEEAKGCSKLHTDYTTRDGSQGILTFTCDSRDPPPVQQRTLTQNQFIQELADERGVRIVG